MADRIYTDKDLYGASGKPQSADIAQGPLGDCYLLSPLGSVAAHQPETIENAIHYNADKNTFSVTLYQRDSNGAAKPTQIEVSQADLQVDRTTGVDSPGYWNQTGNPPLWPQVLESAYAKLNADKPQETMQDELQHVGKGGHASNAIYALTGQHDETVSAKILSNTDMAYDRLQQAVKEGRPMLFNTNPMQAMPNDGLVKGTWTEDPAQRSGHAYMLVGVSKDKDGNVMLTLRNPWGNNMDPKEGVNSADPLVTVNLKQVVDNGHLQSIDIGPAAAPLPDQKKSQGLPPDLRGARETPASPEMSSGCPYVDRLMATVNDPQAFGQAIQAIGTSPYGDAFRVEGHAMNLELQNQQLQHQLTQQQLQPQPQIQQGPVM